MISIIKTWLQVHPKTQEWLWFVGLWIGGLLSVTILTYPIKLLIRYASH